MRQVAVIAVAVAVIGAVVLLTAGVVAGPATPDTLSFFGVMVHTTSAQIFLTGAICTWTLLAGAWLLTAGIRRSRQRGAQLALMRRRTTSGEKRAAASDSPGQAGADDPAGLLGFAVRGERPVADRACPGCGGDLPEPGQDPAEQPLGGQ